MTFTVLTVCAANICRSPLMAVALERAFIAHGLGGDVRLRSAGVNATPGGTACQEVSRLTQARGLPWLAMGTHRSVLLTDRMVDDADLILAADRGLRSDVIKRARPGSTGRTFTLREAAELATAGAFQVEGRTIDQHLRSLTEQMNDSRGFVDLPSIERVAPRARPWRRLALHSHDIPDAHAEPRAHHGIVARVTLPAVEQLASSLSHGALAFL